MYRVEYLAYKNRIYAQATGALTVSDVKNYVKEITDIIHQRVREQWTFFADLRGMDQLNDECYVEINKLRQVMLSSPHRLKKSAVVVDNLINQIKSAKAMNALEETFTEEYFLHPKQAEDFLDE
ncbi:hypothetical protein CS060_01905 [Anoxybacillus flavithermus]|uniref:Uncharacterized protein n=1 Tax=Anoxybacillus flavithermus TaxID=33934 RepID=A0A2G5RUA6_9BACL|nr:MULTISPECIES: hypothetical protein [Anoxybacillus]KFZ42247.1 hypothetical protein JS80_11300 [Anoxybacillus sp. KU2-6(11)]PIC06296.1 hypothetical protein CS060_01905 [Anoxybacillus flavithermus]